MIRLDASFDPETGPPPIGLIVLRADETLEPEFRRLLSGLANPVYVSRVPSMPVVTPAALATMRPELAGAAALLPDLDYAAVGYGCTSASAIIGIEAVGALIREGCRTAVVTDPISATAARAASLGVSRFALVSPYVEDVNAPLRAAFAAAGLEMEVFGSFDVAEEREVVRITRRSVVEAAVALGGSDEVDAVFLSCTNLRTLDAIPEIESRLGKPAISSNSALAWHLSETVRNGGNRS